MYSDSTGILQSLSATMCTEPLSLKRSLLAGASQYGSIRRKGRNETQRRIRWHTKSHQDSKKGTRLMIPTIRQTWEESKVCQQIDLGLLQECSLLQ